MKAMTPPDSKYLLCMEHVVPFSSPTEVRSSMKERASDSHNTTPSTEDVEFHVVSHDRVQSTSFLAVTQRS